jgi:hypothetical protein
MEGYGIKWREIEEWVGGWPIFLGEQGMRRKYRKRELEGKELA